MAKQPSFQFYPGDWLKDPALQKCSASAIGAFINLLCYAFECNPRGYWITNGRQWTIQEMAKMGKVKPKMVQCLADQGVIRWDSERGAWFSKRMVEDERLRSARADSGHLGGKQKASKRLANAKQKSTPSSSSSSSTSVNTPNGVSPGPTARTRKPDPIWDTVVAEWFAAIDPKKIPAGIRTRIGKVVRDLKAYEDCTPAEIVKRRARMVLDFTETGDTPESMAKHWAKFGPKAKAAPNIFDVAEN
jgi:hypothetical protein